MGTTFLLTHPGTAIVFIITVSIADYLGNSLLKLINLFPVLLSCIGNVSCTCILVEISLVLAVLHTARIMQNPVPIFTGY